MLVGGGGGGSGKGIEFLVFGMCLGVGRGEVGRDPERERER